MNGRMPKFERGILPSVPVDEFARKHRLSPEDAASIVKATGRQEAWLNHEYQVNIDKSPPHGFGDGVVIWHLSIKRRDKRHVHDWRDLQAIKNALVGEEYEAVEIYPAESRLVDAANQYHLWVVIEIPGELLPRFPVGFTTSEIDYSTDRKDGSRQRGRG